MNCTSYFDCPSRSACKMETLKCGCYETYGWADSDFPACATQGSASTGAAVCALLVLACALGTWARFARTIAHVARHWRPNSAGQTFALCLAALATETVVLVFAVVLVMAPSVRLDDALFYTDRVAFVLLAVTVLTMSFTFLDLSNSILVQDSRAFYRRVLTLAVAALIVIIVVELVEGNEFVSTTTGVVIVMLVACFAIASPMVLYVRSARSIAKSGDIHARPPSNLRLLVAIGKELLFRHDAMASALGLSGASSRSKMTHESSRELGTRDSGQQHAAGGLVRTNSKDKNVRLLSRGDSDAPIVGVSAVLLQEIEGAKALGHTELRVEEPARLARDTSKTNLAPHDSRQHARMIVFLGRSVRMGFYMTLSLLVFIGCAVASVVVEQTTDTNPDIKALSLLNMFGNMGLLGALFQILLYLEPSFSRRSLLSKSWIPTASKRGSKMDDTILASKRASKQDAGVGALVPHAGGEARLPAAEAQVQLDQHDGHAGNESEML